MVKWLKRRTIRSMVEDQLAECELNLLHALAARESAIANVELYEVRAERLRQTLQDQASRSGAKPQSVEPVPLHAAEETWTPSVSVEPAPDLEWEGQGLSASGSPTRGPFDPRPVPSAGSTRPS